MSVPRTLSPSLSSLVGKDQAAAVAQSAAFIGLASRAARARQTAAPLLITKAEAAFLRNYMASGADPLTAIRKRPSSCRQSRTMPGRWPLRPTRSASTFRK